VEKESVGTHRIDIDKLVIDEDGRISPAAAAALIDEVQDYRRDQGCLVTWDERWGRAKRWVLYREQLDTMDDEIVQHAVSAGFTACGRRVTTGDTSMWFRLYRSSVVTCRPCRKRMRTSDG
jgi:hypothetical protein